MSFFSFYRGPVSNTKPLKDISLKEAIDLIKGDTYKDKILKIRTATDENIAAVLKKNLDYFTFSGTFKKRSEKDLIKHSGLLCLDYDGLTKDQIQDFSLKLREVPEVHAYFVSPSGKGLKIIFKIKVKQHALSFEQIPTYLSDNWELPFVDESGKDLCRACFVSHDPNAYFNPSSLVFECDKVPQTKKVDAATDAAASPVKAIEELPASDQFKNNRYLNRIEYVVEQAEKNNIDITGDYSDWQLIAFSLACIGEQARPLWHRISQLYSEYDPKEADLKFNDALNNGRFKTPAKFFGIARDYGLDVSLPKTIDEKTKERQLLDVIGDEQGVSDLLKYGIYEKGGIYQSLDIKGKERSVSNFNMRILYHVETSDEEAYRMIQIKNIFGLSMVVKMNTDDFVSAGSFKKIIARKGNFLWFGQDSDLAKLQDKLQREERPTKLVSTLGWNKRGSFYAFSNGIFDTVENRFLQVDEYGIVEHVYNSHPQNYFIPAMSKIFADKDDLYTNDKKFKFITSETSFEKWSDLFCKVFGDNGRLGLVFYIASLFSDLIYRDIGQRFPILFCYGQRGSGKGTMIQSLMRLFGEGQDSIGLGGASTVVGFMRKLAQFCNALVWLDEFKNSINPKHIESIKNIYDRVGYERGKKDNTFQTDSTPIRSATIVSGQEMPTGEPALFMRTILLHFKETKRTEKARDLYIQFSNIEENGISHITVMLLKFRKRFEKEFRETYRRVMKEFVIDVNNPNVDERFFVNYAVLIGVVDLLYRDINFPFTIGNIKALCKEHLLDQARIMAGSDDTARFWQIVEQLFNAQPPMIQEGKHFQLKNRMIDIRVQDIYQLYTETLQRRKDPNILDINTLYSYLMGDTKAFVKRHKPFFGGAQRWALQFKYAELGIDLIRGDDSNDLKQKYREMGLPVDELEASIKAEQDEANERLNADINKLNDKPSINQQQLFKPDGDPSPKQDDDLPF